jgi:phytochrome B
MISILSSSYYKGSFKDIHVNDTKKMIHAHLNDLKLQGTNELNIVAIEMVRLIETTTVLILAVDSNGFINGWNANVAQLTRLPIGEVMGRSLCQRFDSRGFYRSC